MYKAAKRVVIKVKTSMRNYSRLGTKNGMNNDYRLTKAGERKIRDLNNVGCVIEKNQNV